MATFLNEGVNPNYEKAIFNNGYRKALEDMSVVIRGKARDTMTNMHERSRLVDLVREAEKELQP